MRLNPDSNKTKTYLFSYFYNNAWWSIEINAYSREDAVQIVRQLPSAKYDGELQKKIPVPCNN